MLEAETDDVEISQGPAGFHGAEGQPSIPQFFLQVYPGTKGPFRGQPVVVVEDVIEDLKSRMGHPYFVDVRKTQGDGNLHLPRILSDDIDFVPHVTTGSFDAGKPFFFQYGHRPYP